MKPVFKALSAAALAVLSVSTFAAATVYTSSSAFLPNVAAGSYTENFDSATNLLPTGVVTFSGANFSFGLSAPGDLWVTALQSIGVSTEDESLTVDFSAGVTAFGANFYATNLSDEFEAVSITLTLSDASELTFTPASVDDSFRGFASDLEFTKLVISIPANSSLYAGIDNLTVGAAKVRDAEVPEPTSVMLAGLGLAGLLVSRRRRTV